MLDYPVQSTSEDGPACSEPAASDQLAHAFLKALAQDERERRKRNAEYDALDASFVDGSDPVEQFLARDEPDRKAEHVPVPPALALVAVLVARAIEAEPDVLRRLRRENPVLVVATHMPEFIDPARTVFEKCALPTGAKIKELSGSKYNDLKRGQVGLVLRDGTLKEHTPDVGNSSVAAALHAGAALIGISPDPKRQLPRDLLRSAEYRLSLPSLDHGALALVVEAVTGGVPTRKLDDALIRTLDVGDLPIALRNVGSADDGIDAIARVLRQKSDYLEVGPSLEELSGYGVAKDWGLALARDLDDYRAGRIGWSEIDNRGLLLSGPPGVGKTSFARALAKSARVPLVATSVAEWNASDYLSGTLQAIRKAFTRARAQAPCILFIDELDGISDRSQIRGEYVQYWTQVVNLFLELLAGVEERPGVVVIAASNHPDRIDPAVKRAGRLDREIAIEKPDTTALADIFRHHLGSDTLVDASTMPLALAARGTTGADVEAFVRRAKGAARRAGRPMSFEDVLAEIRQGRKPLSENAKRRLAVHEAGHAIVCRDVGFGSIIDVSLYDDGGEIAFEHAMTGTATLPELEAVLSTLLAGRVAEEIFFGAGAIGVGFGPDSDLAKVTAIARNIELRYGVGQFGAVYFEQTPNEIHLVRDLLPALSERLRNAGNRARAVLTKRRAALEAIAGALEATAFLSGAEVDGLMGLPAGNEPEGGTAPALSSEGVQ